MKGVLVAALVGLTPAPGHPQLGTASIYGGPDDRHAGTCVAEQKPKGGCYRMDPRALTAAHRTLPFGTIVEVTNRRNGRVAFLRINDRGPFVPGRIIDVTPAGAEALGFDGLAPVQIEVVRP